MMNWILLVMAAIAAVIVAMLLGGAMAPRTRVASRTLLVPRSVLEVYAQLREVDGPPRWCADLPTMRVTSEAAPHTLVLTLLDDDGHDMGTWQVTVEDRSPATGSSTTITETVTVNNLIVRFLRSLGGNGARPQRFLEAVAAQLDVPAEIRAG